MLLTWLPFVVRITIAVTTRTFFQPDEYFQALEPAHRAVFGYGHLTWEWMADPPIRSIIYPSVWVPIYYFLRLTGFDRTGMIVG
jgi:phosphatidylinositol glycan class B